VQTNGPYDVFVNQIVVSMSKEGGTMLFSATDDGVYLSTDNGKNWSAVNNGLPYDVFGYGTFTSLAAFSDGTGGTNLFAGRFGGGFLSTNNGASWILDSAGLSNEYVKCLGVTPRAGGGSYLFAGTNAGVFRSTDNGTSWNPARFGLPWTGYNGAITWGAINALAVSSSGATGTNLFAGTDGSGVYRSTDNGGVWNAVNNGLGENHVRCLAVSDTNLFAATDGGVYRSTDNGSSWIAVNNG
jgi:hypothetical protein